MLLSRRGGPGFHVSPWNLCFAFSPLFTFLRVFLWEGGLTVTEAPIKDRYQKVQHSSLYLSCQKYDSDKTLIVCCIVLEGFE